MLSKPKVLCLLITKDSIEPHCYESIIEQEYPNFTILAHVKKPKYEHDNIMIKTYLNCSDNRNDIRRMALASDADYFLFIDSDIILPKNAIHNLVSNNMDIVGGWYPIIGQRRWVAAKWVADNTILNYTSPIHNELVEVDMIGIGCSMISRKALQSLNFKPGHELIFIEKSLNEMIMGGECIAFGIDAQKKGFKLHMDGRVICKHIIRDGR